MERIEHDGTVLATQKGRVDVRIEVLSACAHCAAHAKCGMADSKDKTVSAFTTDWQSYQPGEPVKVTLSEQNGLKAVRLAYVLPAIIILAAFAVLNIMKVPELWTALITLAVSACYAGILYLVRDRLQKKFAIDIAHI